MGSTGLAQVGPCPADDRFRAAPTERSSKLITARSAGSSEAIAATFATSATSPTTMATASLCPTSCLTSAAELVGVDAHRDRPGREDAQGRHRPTRPGPAP